MANLKKETQAVLDALLLVVGLKEKYRAEFMGDRADELVAGAATLAVVEFASLNTEEQVKVVAAARKEWDKPEPPKSANGLKKEVLTADFQEWTVEPNLNKIGKHREKQTRLVRDGDQDHEVGLDDSFFVKLKHKRTTRITEANAKALNEQSHNTNLRYYAVL